MFGLEDHVTAKGSGRPELHHSWQAERVTTWLGWFMAGICLIGAATYHAKWQESDGVLPMLGMSALFAMIAYLRGKMLHRKKVALREAFIKYERMLAETRW